ncbi:hypothetical protein IFM89_024706 [Coptis chinensis]|uniref:Zinc knuckle CX2CX4HX4C domain-containing protein n=1 Tax=Coptis chinensis TaxID=261450 RepID=A0A835M1L2_9MAGN|nr:hypothetical protein IFM89_024706 [Coptis chinensis]
MIADKNLFYFKFVNDEDRQLVIDHGPLFLAGRIFVVRPWFPVVENLRNGITALPIWIRMDLPKHLWTKNGIDFVSSIIGEPICMDDATTNRTRIAYARICSVVDTNFKFPSQITVNTGGETTMDIGLEYEWLPDLCNYCKVFGHSNANCPKNKGKEVQVQTFGQVQPSCSRDQEGAPISTEGLPKDSLVIISEEGAKAKEGLSNENEALPPLRNGSQIVIHADVHATNRFEVLMPNDEDDMQDAEDS